jgi:mono/diheme cytochrome c family protein
MAVRWKQKEKSLPASSSLDYREVADMKFVQLSARLATIPFCAAALLSMDMALAGDENAIAAGATVFSTVAGVGCKTCHGEYAEGDLGVGPFIRGASEETIRAAIDATGEMVIVKNVITDEEIEAVAAYVGYLGSLQVARTLAKRGRFLPGEFSTRPGTGVQLVIKNSSVAPHTFKSDNMGIDELTIPGRSTGSIEWQAPDAEGEYSLYCEDCKLKGEFFTLHVDMAADEFKGSAPARTVATEDSM